MGLRGSSGGVGRISEFSSNAGREEPVLLVPIREHLPIVKGVLLSDDDLPTHHQVELLRIIAERMLFGDFEGVLCVVEEGKGDGFSPLQQSGTFDLGDFLGGGDVFVCYRDGY